MGRVRPWDRSKAQGLLCLQYIAEKKYTTNLRNFHTTSKVSHYNLPSYVSVTHKPSVETIRQQNASQNSHLPQKSSSGEQIKYSGNIQNDKRGDLQTDQ